MKITQEEFKTLFDLEKDCKIPADTLKMYNKQIEGAYLLYNEVLNISEKKFKNVDGTSLVASYEPFRNGFQQFITTYGSKNKFRVSYIDKHRGKTPFWTYTKYENDVVTSMANSAYKIFIHQVLGTLKYKYSKYHINFDFIDYSRDYVYSSIRDVYPHPNDAIWWDGVTFKSLFYLDSVGRSHELYNRQIQDTICKRTDIWYGNIPDPILRVMKNIDGKLKNKK